MILDVAGRMEIANPTDAQISAALQSFDAGKVEDGEAFVILGSDDMTYMQAGGENLGGFDVEYQEGDTKHHYRATRADFPLDDILAILCAYRDRKPDWKAMAEWERIRV